MATSENNNARPQRVAKKRAAAAICELHRNAAKRKRVVLGDLTNVSSNYVAVTEKEIQKQKKVKREQPARPVSTPEKVEERHDPQLCGPYVSDIRIPSRDGVRDRCRIMFRKFRGMFLSLNALSRQKLQLLGVASMLIASKYEEIKPPDVEDFCYITDNTYSKEEVVNMEADILKALKFELGGPTVKTFLRRFSRVAQEGVDTSDLQFEFLSCYLAELSLLDYNCIKFLPSLVAASVVFLARFMFSTKTHPWNLALHQLTRYKPADLKECVLNLHDLYLSRRGASLQAVREKYKQHKFKCVATTASPPKIPLSFFEFGGQILWQLKVFPNTRDESSRLSVALVDAYIERELVMLQTEDLSIVATILV
ncbi:putative cyclin-A3-1 [Glycine max]|nr:putative cyclin-A3-1 [Glycine max]